MSSVLRDKNQTESRLRQPRPLDENCKLSTNKPITAPVEPVSSLKRKTRDSDVEAATQRIKLDNHVAAPVSKPAAAPATRVSLSSKAIQGVQPKGGTTHTNTFAARQNATAAANAANQRVILPAKRTSTTVTTAKNTTSTAKNTTSSASATANARKPPVYGNSVQKNADAEFKKKLEDHERSLTELQQQFLMANSNMETMQKQLQLGENTITSLGMFRKQLEEDIKIKTQETETISQSNQELLRKIEKMEVNHAEEMNALKRKLQLEKDDLQIALDSSKRNCQNLESDLTLHREEIVQLKAQISSQSTLLVSVESEIRALKSKLQLSEESNVQKSEKIVNLESALDDCRINLKNLEDKIRQDEMVRRKLHNTILELKGNIRVFCRVRPGIGEEKKDPALLSHVQFNESDDKEIALLQTIESACGTKKSVKQFPFSFDRVFTPHHSQQTVFEEISQLVQSALDGYKVCIFAYGQTGSGKTYTMEGPSNCYEKPEELGMIPRAVFQIFQEVETLKEKGWVYTMEASFLEIYNESIRDLLVTNSNNQNNNKNHKNNNTKNNENENDHEKKYEIKHNQNGTTTILDLTNVEVQTADKVLHLLKKASENRAVGETNCNERSSRSHSVFILKLSGHNTFTDEKCEGVLNLIDLAGSERLSSSGAVGDRMKETQSINKSLSSLADVIYALANKEQHIPYRNSKLTYLLQNSLGGNSKTLMFVNVSPLSQNFQETLCSLRFATKVNSCVIGTARKSAK